MTDETVHVEASEPRVKRTRAGRMQRPPEVAGADIDRLFDRIRTMAPPAKVDAAWARSFGLTDATVILTWLGLAKDGKVEDPALWNRVRMPATREAALADLVRASYDRIFAQVDVSEANREDLEGAFVNEYNLGDTRRYIRAFARLCKHAGIQIAAFEQSAEPAAATATPNTPAEPRAPRRPNPKPSAPVPGKQGEVRRDHVQAPAPAINVNIEIPADWTQDQIRERVEAVKRALAEAGES